MSNPPSVSSEHWPECGAEQMVITALTTQYIATFSSLWPRDQFETQWRLLL